MGRAARLLTSNAFGKTFGAVLGLSVLTHSTAMGQSGPVLRDPGHALAEKFAAEADRPAKEAAKEAARREALRKAEEAEMLATAKAEAEARRAALEKARVDAEIAERQAEQRKAAEIAARAAEAKRLADQKLAEEARKIAEARQAAEDKRIAEQKVADERKRVAEDKRILERKAAEARRVAEAKHADEQRRQLEAKAERERTQTQVMAAEREAEGQRVAERLRQAHARREQANSNTETATAPPRTLEPPSALGGPVRAPTTDVWSTTTTAARSGNSSRVTILLLMEPGHRGIRRHNKTADPLLCNGGGCFVSNGPEAAASFFPGRKALGAGRTFGERAGACSRSLGCVFRDIDLGSLPVSMQPIDMRVMIHDRRSAQTIDAPADCRAEAGRLMCRRTIQSGDYTMWVIPEDIARTAGAAALERALAEGLPDQEHAALPHVGSGSWRR